MFHSVQHLLWLLHVWRKSSLFSILVFSSKTGQFGLVSSGECVSGISWSFSWSGIYQFRHFFGSLLLSLLLSLLEVKGWRSGESTCLPPSGPGSIPRPSGVISGLSFFVLYSATKGFFSWYSGFPFSSKTNI